MNNIYTNLFTLKKVLLLLIFVEFFNFSATANPGDTTWVTVFNLRKITYHGTYDTTSVFPTGKRYRKIRMHYILGRYACPAGSQYCGSWDYTTQVYARPAGKDSVEIARVITPYATDWLTLNKKHDYIVDVTDYASVLQGSTAMRYFYDGYSWGFTLTLKLEMIEGVPPMDAVSVKNVYDGYYTYGAAPTATNYIENYLVPKPFSYTATTRPFIKNTVSGHGSDNTGCSEFCSKYYQLKVDNNLVSQNQLWRSSCGLNEVYPQTGTWIYERANWCPGEVVHPIYHDLTSLTTANTTFSVDVDMQPYTTANPSAGYNFVSHFINYSSPNHSLDVSIDDIISPTKDDNYYRENPTCANPTIKIRNTGTQMVTSVVFNYGLHGQTPLTYTWTTDSLKFLEETVVVFPSASSILSGTVSNTFEVSVVSVNGAADQDLLNNTYSSQTSTIAVLPTDFIIRMVANNSTSGGTNETSWSLFDDADNLLYSGGGASGGTYTETLSLTPGCYRFSIDDIGCDGMYFFANTAGGTGSIKFMNANGVSSFYSAPADFGCNFTKFFTVPVIEYVGIKNNLINPNAINIYPNPSGNTASMKFNLGQSQNLTYRIIDLNGRVMQQKSLSKVMSQSESLDLSQLSDGMYIVSLEFENSPTITKKLMIRK